MKSHPTWVRGLKQSGGGALCAVDVAPYVGAWIETNSAHCATSADTSHPTWVRGLKPAEGVEPSQKASRTLRGCVD